MRRTYAIGDVHGCLTKLSSLVKACELDCHLGEIAFVFVGDYVDRGPDSRGVVEFLIALQLRLGGNVICLRGNHEALAIENIITGKLDHWLYNGGATTLESYGVSAGTDIPAEHRDWLCSLPITYDDGMRFFVHAGVNPDRALDHQDEHDLLWIREPFLLDQRNYGRLIVHGHTPVKTFLPESKPNRLNIDTGAYLG